MRGVRRALAFETRIAAPQGWVYLFPPRSDEARSSSPDDAAHRLENHKAPMRALHVLGII